VTERCYIDTCVYVVVFKGGDQDHPERLEPALHVLESAQRSEIEAVTSVLTIAEVFGTPLVGGHVPPGERSKRATKAGDYFRSSPETLVELDERLAHKAAALASEHQLKGGDAVHVASAIRARCQRLYTWDRSILAIGHIDGVDITTPAAGQQTSLPLDT
jgi:predicted nucleic acid-binding protein